LALAPAQHRRLHEARAPDWTGAAADMLGNDHADFKQHGADVGLVDSVPFGEDLAIARGKRSAEVTVARQPVEVREKMLVLQHRIGGGLQSALDARLRNLTHW